MYAAAFRCPLKYFSGEVLRLSLAMDVRSAPISPPNSPLGEKFIRLYVKRAWLVYSSHTQSSNLGLSVTVKRLTPGESLRMQMFT